jgi:GT2 family glycosyltransferase
MIYVVIPVHNRKKKLERVLECLADQTLVQHARVVIVDAGSTDGTSEFLKNYQVTNSFLSIVQGETDWFWAQSTMAGIDHIKDSLQDSDYVLLLNDDTELKSDYLVCAQKILEISPNSILSSVLCDLSTEEVFHYGIDFDPSNLWIGDMHVSESKTDLFSVKLASGRGTFYPAKTFLDGLTLDWKKVPHYLADYKISAEARLLGYEIIGSDKCKVYSSQEFGNQIKLPSIWKRLTDVKSPDRIASYWFFWRANAPELSGFRLAFRILRFRALGALSRNSSSL